MRHPGMSILGTMHAYFLGERIGAGDGVPEMEEP